MEWVYRWERISFWSMQEKNLRIVNWRLLCLYRILGILRSVLIFWTDGIKKYTIGPLLRILLEIIREITNRCLKILINMGLMNSSYWSRVLWNNMTSCSRKRYWEFLILKIIIKRPVVLIVWRILRYLFWLFRLWMTLFAILNIFLRRKLKKMITWY